MACISDGNDDGGWVAADTELRGRGDSGIGGQRADVMETVMGAGWQVL